MIAASLLSSLASSPHAFTVNRGGFSFHCYLPLLISEALTIILLDSSILFTTTTLSCYPVTQTGFCFFASNSTAVLLIP